MLRKYFNAMSVREALLLGVFMWIGIFIWMGAIMREISVLRTDYIETQQELKYQQDLIDQVDWADQELEKALELVDRGKTFGSSRLVGKLDSLARTANLDFDINTPVTERGLTFNIHNVRIQFKQADIGELIEFDKKLKRESPYIGLNRVQITANKTDPRKLTAQFVVSSFELTEQPL